MILTLEAFAAIGLILGLLAWGTRKLSVKAGGLLVRRVGLASAILFGIVGLSCFGFAVYLASFLALGQPTPEDRMLGEGVRYQREVFDQPRRMVVHILQVDLSRGHRIVASPPSVGLQNEATIATKAIDDLKADVLINANFFNPFRDSTLFDYFPHEGDLVTSLGATIGQGKRYGQSFGTWVTFWSSPSGAVGFGDPPADADAAVSGIGWLVQNGQNVVNDQEGPYPRTALALDAARKQLWLVIVDGKQPRYSLGMTLRELSETLLRLGASDAIQLDGGGSSILSARDNAGRAVLLSRPCHTKIPGRQRPVANFLGVVFPRRSVTNSG
jgi:hypothetical protein